MKILLSVNFGLTALASIVIASHAKAAVNVEFVTVGNAGNAADPYTGYGAVAYNYQIAKNETTVGQYCEFLNTKARSDPYQLYSSNMVNLSYVAEISRSGADGDYSYSVIGSTANKPITYVSWFDAARFCNWLQNGQGSGSTETGAYTLNGAMRGIYTVNAGATIWIPSADEWYKAAFYDATKGGKGGYWRYSTRSNDVAGNTIGVPNSANYYDGDYVGYPGMALTDVGAYGAKSASYYGTNDQGGNVWEWNDTVIGSSRELRGASWLYDVSALDAYASRMISTPSSEGLDGGFRIATVPEPSCVVLTLLASGVLLTRRKR